MNPVLDVYLVLSPLKLIAFQVAPCHLLGSQKTAQNELLSRFKASEPGWVSCYRSFRYKKNSNSSLQIFFLIFNSITLNTSFWSHRQ